MTEYCKYNIVNESKGDQIDNIFDHPIHLYLPGFQLTLNGKNYKVFDFPTKIENEDFWRVNIEKI